VGRHSNGESRDFGGTGTGEVYTYFLPVGLYFWAIFSALLGGSDEEKGRRLCSWKAVFST